MSIILRIPIAPLGHSWDASTGGSLPPQDSWPSAPSGACRLGPRQRWMDVACLAESTSFDHFLLLACVCGSFQLSLGNVDFLLICRPLGAVTPRSQKTAQFGLALGVTGVTGRADAPSNRLTEFPSDAHQWVPIQEPGLTSSPVLNAC